MGFTILHEYPTRIAALATIDPERDFRPMPDGIAQRLQPAEGGLFASDSVKPAVIAYRVTLGCAASVKGTRSATIICRHGSSTLCQSTTSTL